jgi:hypothetical protein
MTFDGSKIGRVGPSGRRRGHGGLEARLFVRAQELAGV